MAPQGGGGGQLGQTITVVNKSGKVISSSKHLLNVFKEAKSAYRERKAEIKAHRSAEIEEKRARLAIKNMSIADDNVDNASRASRSKHPQRTRSIRDRPPMERGVTDSFYINENIPYPPAMPGQDTAADRAFDEEIQRRQLQRRHTEGPGQTAAGSPERRLSYSHSDPHVDMDLAYGDLPGGDFPPPVPATNMEEQVELREKMSKLTFMLDEANCVQHSVTAMIENLQKDPDALAAVALTLAEASSLARKMAPSVIKSMRAAFPAAMALLASPQFMIAGGVAIGVTIVALGGYKIVKKIKSDQASSAASLNPDGTPRALDEPLALGELEPPELSRIEMWRRGIADEQAASVGTTVDGEFITPLAERRLIAEGVLDGDRAGLDNDDAKSRRTTATRRTSASSASGRKHRSKSDSRVHRAKSVRSERTDRSGKSSRSKSLREDGGSNKHHHHHHHHKHKDGEKEEKKRKGSIGGIQMLFKPQGS